MQMITNTANVTDFSGATPIITYSNAVVTLIRQEPTSQIYIHRPRCNCHCPFTAPNFAAVLACRIALRAVTRSTIIATAAHATVLGVRLTKQ
ncbi:MAG: hypothetical protein K2P32_00845 [Clostridia bacterium]|nr:hypothetical protein [Clostridia bacterium]